MGCRFAGGVNSPDDYWDFLLSSSDGIGEVPPERWESYAAAGPQNAAALRRTTRHGGFLDDIEGFDAEFFGITPREAELMDPQQRIVLEVAWEALEHAGVSPHALAGTDTGVFIGVGSDDYGRRMLEDLPRIEAWTGIGSAFCAVANRVSYSLDLRGSSLAVDTACSASLVALHLACQALRLGECPVALAGGVNIMAGPGLTMVLDAAGAVSPDGRSKSFDASADGYGRGEGAGVIVLKRLSDAQRDGDRILALVRGSAVHQDGRTNGIMAPSAEAQAHLLRRAYRNAGVDPSSVDYVEAHGTGTRAGDPIEARAMAEVFGAGRPANEPCLIGSVKPNIGHLEAGAGVAGVIKAVLALWHGEIPPQANFSEPNPAIPWQDARLRVVDRRTPWPRREGPHRAGVSGYGYGGTIGHVVLEQAPARPERTDDENGSARLSEEPRLFPLSGATPGGLAAQAGRLAEWLSGAGAQVAVEDVRRTLAVHRTHLTARSGVLAADRDHLVEALRGLAADEPGESVTTGVALPGADQGVVWVFSGHGSQWAGMGRGMLERSPEFAAVIDAIEPVFMEEIGFSPRQVIEDGDLGGVDRIQPMIFAVQVALAEVWRVQGLRPAAVIGHSVGEIAGAVVAGMLDLADGARLICRRSALLRRVAGRGGMIMVSLPFDTVAERLSGRTDLVAAIDASPTSAVVAGDAEAVARLGVKWAEEGITVRKVASDAAFHSPHMDPLLAELLAAADDLDIRPPHIPVYSTALADPRSRADRDGAYWAANLRNPVRFAQAVAAAVDDGYRLFLEVSAHPVVAHSASETLDHHGVEDAFVGHTLRRNRPELPTLLANLSALYAHGAPLDWASATEGRLADLPTTAWQHQPFWYEGSPNTGVSTAHDVDSHTLLGAPVTVHGSTPARLWQTHLDPECRPYPGDHPVQGVEIVPATVLLNTFFTAAADGGPRPGLSDVSLRVPVAVTTPRRIQVVVQEGTVRLTSRIDDGQDGDDMSWLTHTTAHITPGLDVGERTLDAGELRALTPEVLDNPFVIDRLASIGVAAMGFPWQVEELRRADGRLFAVVSAGPDGEPVTSWASVLDAALSIASVVFPGAPVLRMPAHIQETLVEGDSPQCVLLDIRTVSGPAAVDTVDVAIAGLDGTVRGRLTGLRYGVLDGDPGATASPRRLVSELTWHPLELPERDGADRATVTRVVLVGDTAAAEAFGPALKGAGLDWTTVEQPEALADPAGRPGEDTAVLVLPARLPDAEPTAAATAGAWLLTRTAQVLAEADAAGVRLWAVTRGVRESGSPAALGDAPLWGLGRVIAGEYAQLWGGIVDLADMPSEEQLATLAQVVSHRPEDDVVVVRDGECSVARLTAIEREPVRPPLECRPDGTYLITGGLGVLGLEVAAWLAGRGARRLVLVSRRGLPLRADWSQQTDPAVQRQIEAVRALEALGVTVRVVALDIADAQAARELLSPQALDLPPIRGVVHAAGVLDNRMVATVDEASLAAVLRPKTAGALVLHELFPPGSVDFFALFSSCGLLLGLTGQASYASANSFLDALSAHRRATGHQDTVSFGWTSWRGLGMSTSSEVIDAELALHGTADISAADAFRSWEFASCFDTGYVAVLRTIALEPGAVRPPLLSRLAVETRPSPADEAEAEWAALAPEALREYLVDQVRQQVAAEMKAAPSAFDIRRPLSELGLDSVMTVIIRRRLEKALRIGLPATLLWDRPTVQAIADYLLERLSGEGAATEASAVAAVVDELAVG